MRDASPLPVPRQEDLLGLALHVRDNFGHWTRTDARSRPSRIADDSDVEHVVRERILHLASLPRDHPEVRSDKRSSEMLEQGPRHLLYVLHEDLAGSYPSRNFFRLR